MSTQVLTREIAPVPDGTITVQYIALSALVRALRNPKDHDLGQLHTSMNRWGYTVPCLIDERTGRLVAGHGRLETLEQKKALGESPPSRVIERDSEWYIPVFRGVRFNSDAEAEAYLLADNRLVEVGGWRDHGLAGLLADLAELGEDAFLGTGFDGDDLDNLLAQIEAEAMRGPTTPEPSDSEREKLAQVDLIYTAGAYATAATLFTPVTVQVHCCLAVQSGWLYGFQSAKRVCGFAPFSSPHRPQFIDNNYFDYQHETHLKQVETWRPKYATVCDVMTEEQCQKAGIRYYPLGQILEWADEVERLTGSGDVAVLLQGEHLCMVMRGIKTPGRMTSSVMRGVFRDQPEARAEFMALI